MSLPPVITVDGPSGAGKGTISQRLAQMLEWHWLDSGALYRAAVVACQHRGVSLDDPGAVAAVAQHLNVRFAGGKLWLFGQSEVEQPAAAPPASPSSADQPDPRPPAATTAPSPDSTSGNPAPIDITRAIRAEAAGRGASAVAAMPAVRAALLRRQRDFRQPPGLVADGRDMGTVVFPDAPLKFFLTASVEERARRRQKQLQDAGEGVNLPRLLRDMRERDERDSSRAASPLVPADDAIIIDSTATPVDSVLAKVMASVTARFEA